MKDKWGVALSIVDNAYGEASRTLRSRHVPPNTMRKSRRLKNASQPTLGQRPNQDAVHQRTAKARGEHSILKTFARGAAGDFQDITTIRIRRAQATTRVMNRPFGLIPLRGSSKR
jgi:hypothetical protein